MQAEDRRLGRPELTAPTARPREGQAVPAGRRSEPLTCTHGRRKASALTRSNWPPSPPTASEARFLALLPEEGNGRISLSGQGSPHAKGLAAGNCPVHDPSAQARSGPAAEQTGEMSLPMQNTPSPSLADDPARPQASVLLVDDQPANLLALEAVLGDLGHPLVKAGSGEEALRLLLDRDFAVVLLDVRMPGMDGFQTARHIRGRERSRHTPIIFLTAVEERRSSLEEAYSLGAVDYLVKPLVPAILRAKVAAFIDLFQRRSRPSGRRTSFGCSSRGPSTTPSSCSTPRGGSSTWNAGAERIKGYTGRGDRRPALLPVLPAGGRRPGLAGRGVEAGRGRGPVRGRGLAGPQGRLAASGPTSSSPRCGTRPAACGGSPKSPAT